MTELNIRERLAEQVARHAETPEPIVGTIWIGSAFWNRHEAALRVVGQYEVDGERWVRVRYVAGQSTWATELRNLKSGWRNVS